MKTEILKISKEPITKQTKEYMTSPSFWIQLIIMICLIIIAIKFQSRQPVTVDLCCNPMNETLAKNIMVNLSELGIKW